MENPNLQKIKNGDSLDTVPLSERTAELCFEAVTVNPYNLLYVPEHLRSHALCRKALSSVGWLLQYVPNAVLDEDLCITAILSHPVSLKFVPRALRTNRVLARTAERLRYCQEYEREAVTHFFPASCRNFDESLKPLSEILKLLGAENRA